MIRVLELTDWTPDALCLTRKTSPVCAPDGVLIQMKAASLNYRDTLVVRQGYGRLTGSLPLVPVSDGAGVVIETGKNVSDLKPGDLVTPFFDAEYTLNRHGIGANRVDYRYYGGGHMMYVNEEARLQLMDDVRDFITGSLAGTAP